ncbi:DUF6199 family natural product biosynthesis protein [Streptomyces sp. NPDC087440]|uniref:DUF6199 family natural product biosynthesis protein n=1 Tax=Streptomyces sp. NPDC087440 TaxID=3365790 RepID=UPI0037F1E09A
MRRQTALDVTLAAAKDGPPTAMTWVIMAFLLVMGLVQVIRPQLLWRMNRGLQRGYVKDVDATEPTRKGYALQRVVGVIFLGVLGWMFVSALT